MSFIPAPDAYVPLVEPRSGLPTKEWFDYLKQLESLNTSFSAALAADVALNNAANFFDGPSVDVKARNGTWFVIAGVTLVDTAAGAASNWFAKLWDGTTVISAAAFVIPIANQYVHVTLSGIITDPAGNLRMSVRDVGTATGKILANVSSFAKDSQISAVRIA